MKKSKLAPEWYYKAQLDFDKKLIALRYRYLKPFIKQGKILEMGPADGVMTKRLIVDFSDSDIYIIDGSQEHINTIPDSENLTKICSYFEEWSPDIHFDTIIMEHVLEHVNDPVKILKRASLWLKDNGIIIVGVPNAKSFHRLVAVKIGFLKSIYQLNERDKKQGHQRIYDADLIEVDIKAANLKIVKKDGIFFKPLTQWQINETWDDKMIEGFYQLGFDFPNNAADIIFICKK